MNAIAPRLPTGTWPTQLSTPHITCLIRPAATAAERIALATAVLRGTGYTVTMEASRP